MRFLLFTISLILAALVAVYYSDLTDEDIRHAIQFDSEKLEQQTKRARKQADATVEAVNGRLKGLREEYARIRAQVNKESAGGKENFAEQTEKTVKATQELQEKITQLGNEARTQFQEQADYLQKQVKALKETVESELENQGSNGKSR
jgi:F0F1-type ATP synthase membrane subunit b/b'